MGEGIPGANIKSVGDMKAGYLIFFMYSSFRLSHAKIPHPKTILAYLFHDAHQQLSP